MTHCTSSALPWWTPSATLLFYSFRLVYHPFKVPSFFAGLGADFDALQIVGAAAVDTLGDHTPPKRLPSGVKKQRQKMAYVSNVAVAPGARRQGVAAALLREAEQVRKEIWTPRNFRPAAQRTAPPIGAYVSNMAVMPGAWLQGVTAAE